VINTFITKVFGTKHERDVKEIRPLVERIGALEPRMKALSEEQMRETTAEFRRRVAGGEPLDSLLPEAFALVREAGVRVLGMRHFDVQLIGGVVLHRGRIAEMKTGEGKTLVATCPVYLNALAGKGVHVVTVNDYLARRDAEWMGKIYRLLGLSVGVIQHHLNDDERKAAYGCDVTYGTNNEFGFDYLRDNMKFELESMVQRGHHYAIVDEVDSILIDEARTPLIISGPSEGSTDRYYVADRIVPKLIKGREIVDKHGEKSTEGDYLVDEKSHTAVLTDEGVLHAEKLLGVENLYDPSNMDLLHCVQQALRAHTLYKLDVQYMIKGTGPEAEVVIVDEFTGRLMPGRRWSDGLHQAVEAKEGVKIQRENQTLATITLQNYFRMYKKLSGMTGTAATEEAEFQKIYNLDVTIIPTNRASQRIDHQDLIYRTEREKFAAVVEEVAEKAEKGQPALVGTISIEKSELLSKMLKQRGVRHVVLNAKYHEREAEIVAQAGVHGSVTIATNMAGRGTDIILGGNPEYRADPLLRQAGYSRLEGVGSLFLGAVLRNDLESARRFAAEHPALDEALIEKIRAIKKETDEDHERVVAAGGLHILGTERHESRRIDNQLRGRSGRQGDPGSSRFYLSLEDDLMRIFGSDRLQGVMQRLGMEEGVPIEHTWVTKSIARAQTQVEGRNFESRKHLLEYDDVMNKQRESIYSLRKDILEGNQGKDYVFEASFGILDVLIEKHGPSDKDKRADWDADVLQATLSELFALDLRAEGIDLRSLGIEAARARLRQSIEARYRTREALLGEDTLRLHEKFILLSVVDQQWKDHLLALDHLKEGIGLRGYGQRDPLVEYKKESFDLFQDMMDRIEEQVVRYLFHLEPRQDSRDAMHYEGAMPPDDEPGPGEAFVLDLPPGAGWTGTTTASGESAAPAREAKASPASAPASRAASVPVPQRKRETYIYDGSSLGGGDGTTEGAQPKKAGPKVGRNDPCPCGSGKKYKKCHGDSAAAGA
jgi:preprotein translocase subunit SecA